MERFDSKRLEEKKRKLSVEGKMLATEVEVLIEVYGEYLPQHKLDDLKRKLERFKMREKDIDEEFDKPL